MSKDEKEDLLVFIRPYPPDVQELALWLREWVWDLYPACNELIYDSYNAVAFGWSPTDRLGHSFCSVAVMSRYVHFGFYWGSEITDPEKRLLGKGNQYRYIVVKEKADFPKTYMKKLLKEAYANSLAKVKDKTSAVKDKTPAVKDKTPPVKGQTIIKAIYSKKKRPGIG